MERRYTVAFVPSDVLEPAEKARAGHYVRDLIATRAKGPTSMRMYSDASARNRATRAIGPYERERVRDADQAGNRRCT